ncbi:glycosyltransferase [Xanthocytophaga agilis]|uniref:Glycosyltransferase n=1 Tax=Xanthocytophaga agilis TaxID=3048010 RepID=A0AAE3UI47_9BACT|nr:glycosyltransferase [Xanthocytophaga agilis]MDJ1503253.1 glycosyltransferase [Xanthocytophaga agilis]
MIFAYIFLIIQILYALFTLILWIAWQKLPLYNPVTEAIVHTRISVIVVVRNEASNILNLLNSLSHQTYPKHLFSVYIVDDYSTDATVSLLKDFQSTSPFPLHILELKNYSALDSINGNFKKKGIEWAISKSDGELIAMTDGDCLVPPNWLTTIARFQVQTNAQMICGAVTFTEPTIFAKIQAVEFASLIGSGAATLQMGIPTMCNAANLVFTRRAFIDVNGYKDTASTATGDDLFLMHKIHQVYPTQVHFLKHPQTIVLTQPQPDLIAFYHQRKRWASKWHLYSDWRVSGIAIFIFVSSLSLLTSIPALFLNILPILFLIAGISLRWVSEWLFMGHILSFLKKRHLITWIFPIQWLYPIYIVFFGLTAQKKGYSWKGRKLDQ